MTNDTLLGFVLLILVASVTPGPNNLMVMASGANFGLRRTVPHILGVAIGFSVMIGLTGIGLARAIDALPWLQTVLTVLSLGFLLFLAWKIATAAPPDPSAPPGKPLTLWQAAAFQWVNPKSWAMALTATTVYLSPGQTPAAAAIAFAMPLVFCTLWTVAGEAVGRLLGNPRHRQIFNVVMAGLLLISMLPALL